MISRGPRYANIFIFTSAGTSSQNVSFLCNSVLVSFVPIVVRPDFAVVGFVTIVKMEGPLQSLCLSIVAPKTLRACSRISSTICVHYLQPLEMTESLRKRRRERKLIDANGLATVLVAVKMTYNMRTTGGPGYFRSLERIYRC